MSKIAVDPFGKLGHAAATDKLFQIVVCRADSLGVPHNPVFHQPSGRRDRATRRVMFGFAAVVCLLGGSVAIAVYNPPFVEPLPMGKPTAAATTVGNTADLREATCGNGGLGSGKRTMPCAPMPVSRFAATPVDDPIVAAFAVQWDVGSRAALRNYGSHLDWVIVEGAFLGRGRPGEVTFTIDPDLLADARKRQVDVHLMITNFGVTDFDSSLVEQAVGTAEQRAHTLRQLVGEVQRHDLAGVTVDFELVPAAFHAPVLTFISQLRDTLHTMGAVVSVAVPIGVSDGYPISEYGNAVDYLIPMLYDEHSMEDAAGPIASASWLTERLDMVLASVPANKLLVGLGQYGYHWRSDRPEASTISVSEAMALGRSAEGGPAFSASQRNPTASWVDAVGVNHTVWYLDAVTAWNHLRTAFSTGAAGVAVWRLGSEDATLWRVLDKRGVYGTADSLRSLPNTGVSIITGDGEVLAVEGQVGNGARSMALDSAGYIVSQEVARSPGGFIVSKGGAHKTRVALTFDDGPDPEFTTQILDTLKSRHAPASFFVLGRQVQRYPDVVRRIANEGHEIGNHSWSHPEFAGLSESAIRVELTATGRVIEAVTGRRPLLFRPPYIGDARPSTEERLRPMAIANDLGYRVAGLSIDPKDWYESEPEKIIASTMRGIRRGTGRIVLLHDAGGDRSATIAALGPLIDSLRASGYEPSTVAGLLNETQLAGTLTGMSDAPRDEAPQRALNVAALRFANVAERAVVGVFFLALVLGVIRLVLIGGLATVQRFVPRYARRANDRAFQPRVSVLIPAYNEDRVIARTINSVLAQTYPNFDVWTIDDGSTDDTFTHARSASADTRLHVLRQPNAGKAAALNTGIAHASGDIVVVIDADTILAPNALHHLVRPLSDSRVGAVAGNAKVGNRVNLLTKWQAVEYVTSQNLDRRAFVMLNCITVVPGAIGAWRRSAITDAGGFCSDTLAEDQDLTMTLLRRGHRVALADQAIALTEAPEKFDALLKQRFRWSFGTLQCAWKHRSAFLRPRAGALGMVGLPNVLLFQLLFPLLAPAADLTLIAALIRLTVESPAIGTHAAWVHAAPVVWLYLLFLCIDTATAVLGVALEPGERVSQSLLVPLQRIAYRQVLYMALVKAVRAALKGWAPGWGKLERTGRMHEHALLYPNVDVGVIELAEHRYVGTERRRKAS